MDLPDSWAPVHGFIGGWALPVLAAGAVIGRAFLARSADLGKLGPDAVRRGERVFRGLLLVMAIVATANYLDYGRFRYGTYLNEWDSYHYYLGTKYVSELGYGHLYEATLVADRDTAPPGQPMPRRIRDLRTYELVDAEGVLAHAERIRALFGQERWRAFVRDVGWFRSQLPPERWVLIYEDHGHNAPPPWTAVLGAITNLLSIEDPVARFLLVTLDPILLGAMLIAVAWAFGIDVALALVVFVGTHYLFSWGHLKGAICRLDFTACSVIAVAFLRRGRHAAAGAFLGWATVSRGFPGLLAVGPIVLFLSAAVRRRIDRPWLAFLLSMATVIVAACVFAVIRFGSVELFGEWVAKIGLHARLESDWNVGFRTIVQADFVDGVPRMLGPSAIAEEPELVRLHSLVIWAVRALILVPLLVFFRYLRAHEALLAGFVLVFFLVAPNYYYYLFLCLPFLFFADRLEERSSALGLAWMYLTGSVGYLLFMGWERMAPHFPFFQGFRQTFPTYFYLSWCVCITALHVFGRVAASARAASITGGSDARAELPDDREARRA